MLDEVMVKATGPRLRRARVRVLVIGGTNFIGPALVRRLVAFGHETAVFHRGRTQAQLPPAVEHILGDRQNLRSHVSEFQRFGPEVVVDMIAFTQADALGLLQTFGGLARRSVVISSADVYRAYGRCLGSESGPTEPTPLVEEAALRTALYPYRAKAPEPDDFLYSYDKIPVEGTVLGDSALPRTVFRLPMVRGPADSSNRLSPYVERMDRGRPAIVLDERMARWKCPRGYVEDVAAAIALAVVSEQAAGRIYNVAEPVASSEAEWVRRIGEVVGWRGKVVTVPAGRVPLAYDMQQSFDTDSSRIRRELKDAGAIAF